MVRVRGLTCTLEWWVEDWRPESRHSRSSQYVHDDKLEITPGVMVDWDDEYVGAHDGGEGDAGL
jgi:hypothetical protein